VTVFHDLQHLRHPENFRWFDLPPWRFFLFWSAHISRMLLAISPRTAADLKHYYRVPDQKVRIAPLAADEEFFNLAARRQPEPFILAASTLHPHKNLDGLLKTFAEFRKLRPEFRLVVTGIHGFFTGPLFELRNKLGLADVVEFPGWIPRADLHELFRRANAFVYPSLFEGFGLPVVEALAAGIPTACSRIEPLASMAGDAALLFDPKNIAEMVDAMLRLTGDEPLRTRLAAAGPRRARNFTWRATAEATLDALQSVV
jgi:glycosyltransferase involved in cell wall biosynthesis